MLEDVAAGQHGVAGHVIHPPDQALPPLGDEVLLEAARGLFLRQVGHRDDREALHQAGVEPVEVLVPAEVDRSHALSQSESPTRNACGQLTGSHKTAEGISKKVQDLWEGWGGKVTSVARREAGRTDILGWRRGRGTVPAVDLHVGVCGRQAVGHVALHALELGLLGGVVDGAAEGVGVLLPLGPVLPQRHADALPLPHQSGRLPQQEGLPPGLDEGGEPVEVPPDCCRALGLLLLGAAVPPARQGGGERVEGGHAAQATGDFGGGRAVVPVVVPVVVAALAGVEAS